MIRLITASRPVLVLAGLIAALCLANVAHAEDPEVFKLPGDGEPGQHNILFSDGEVDYFSSLINTRRLNDSTLDPTCESLQDSKCINDNLEFSAILGMCTSADDVNCISDVGVIKGDYGEVKGSFVRKFPFRAENEFRGDAESGLPSGTSSSLISLPEAAHLGGTEYLVTAYMGGSVTRNENSIQVGLRNFVIRIVPVKLKSFLNPCVKRPEDPYSCVDSGFTSVLGADGVRRWGSQGPGTDGREACVIRSPRENLCAEVYNFPRDLTYYVKVRSKLKFSGWMHGRVTSPNIDLKTNAGITEFRVEAKATWVPKLYRMNYWKDLPTTIRNEYVTETGQLKNGQSSGFSYIPLPNQRDPLTRNFTLTPQPFDSSAMRELQLWLPLFNDRATAVQSSWIIRTLSEGELAGSNGCFMDASRVTGIVSTNSTTYSAGPPFFNKESGSLDYKVAAPHFDSKGDIFRGQYSLVMRSEVARCVYGFSDAPIRAEISVIGANGAPQIATLSVTESQGWLRMSAFDFEFSSPVLRAKIKQVNPNPTATSSVNPQTPTAAVLPLPKEVRLKRTITCVKGSKSRKISGISPKCPNGFKRA